MTSLKTVSRESLLSIEDNNDDDVDEGGSVGRDGDDDEDIASLYSDQNNEASSNNSYATACDINLTERLIRCHPIWFLPDIQRSGAIHLLQGKEQGNFIVRQSSQTETMALSVRLPTDNGPYIEHYLIQAVHGKLSLETSQNTFDSVPDLISHYCQCCDELPVQLCLPEPLKTVKTRQQLTSLALLGQEFWRYSKSKNNSEVSGFISSPDSDILVNNNTILKTFKNCENSIRKAVRPNTLNLTKNNAKSLLTLNSSNSSCVKTPPIPPPRWVNLTPSTPNNIKNEEVETEFNTVIQSHYVPAGQSNELADAKNHSSSTSSSQNSKKNSSVKNEVLSPMQISSSLSIVSPSSVSMLSSSVASRTVSSSQKNIKKAKNLRKDSKHYQESDILDSINLYRYDRQEEKLSDYESLFAPELLTFKSTNSSLISPDLIPNRIVSLSENVLSPAGSQCDSTSYTVLLNEDVARSTNSADGLFNEHKSDYGSTKCLVSDFVVSTKAASTLYAQPADAIQWKSNEKGPLLKRFFRNPLVLPTQRYSNPPLICLDNSKENLTDLTNTMSSSVDNLFYEAKNKSKWNLKSSDSWQVDNNWHFFHKLRHSSNLSIKNSSNISMNTSILKTHNFDDNQNELDNQTGYKNSENDSNDNYANTNNSDHVKDSACNRDHYTPEHSDKNDCVSLWVNSFPPLPVFTHHLIPNCYSSKLTVHQLIAKKNPELNILETFSENELDEEANNQISAYENYKNIMSSTYSSSEISDCTNFSEPWTESSQNNNICGNCNNISDLGSENGSVFLSETSIGTNIRNYTLSLGKDKQTTFARNIENFISCTKESKETNPQIVMRNIRQFMSGMKNYLVKHGEKGFQKEVERERRKLKPNEFLNLDSILESVLHRLVIEPLRSHLQTLFVEHFSENGSVLLLVQNIKFAQTKSTEELGIRSELVLPSNESLSIISRLLNKLQLADSPLEKLDFLLSATSKIFESVKTVKSQMKNLNLGADDFLPILVWVIAKTNFVAAEIESEYMWGLLNQSVLSGEGGYYLTTLSSAVDVLKNIQNSVENFLNPSLEGSSVIKVIVPNELQGSILTKTLPVKSNMTTKQICKIIAHKARITNPQDYALYRLIDDEETLLMDNECPQNFKSDKHCLLVYKRIDAKIAWPKS